MAFIIFSFLKKFEKIEKTGIISTKLSLRCTPSVILGCYLIISTPHIFQNWPMCIKLTCLTSDCHCQVLLPLKHFAIKYDIQWIGEKILDCFAFQIKSQKIINFLLRTRNSIGYFLLFLFARWIRSSLLLYWPLFWGAKK